MDAALKIISIVFIVIGAFIVYGASYISKRFKIEKDNEDSINNDGNDQKILNIKIIGTCFVIVGVIMVLVAFR